MARTINSIKKIEYVTVMCIDNGLKVKAELQDKRIDSIVVKLDNGLILRLKKHVSILNLYVGQSAGLEFQCKL